MTPGIVEGISHELDAFQDVSALIVELHFRTQSLADETQPRLQQTKAEAALAVWHRLAELGVDLGLDDLKTAIAATAAGTRPPSGAVSSAGAATPGETRGAPAEAARPAPLGHHEIEDDIPWQPSASDYEQDAI